MRPPVRVFVVDDSPNRRTFVRNVVASAPGFQIAGEASDGTDALIQVARLEPDLVLMDVEIRSMDGPTVTRAITDQFPDCKVIAWTAREEPHIISEMIAAGAIGYLVKDTSPHELMESLRWAADGQSVLSRNLTTAVMKELTRFFRDAEQRARQLHDSYVTTVASLTAALEAKDDQTGNHARRVRDYAAILARNLDRKLVYEESLLFGFLLHDVGKIGIPESILLKPGPLTEEEWIVMRTHPEKGAHILQNADFLQPYGLEVVMSHHERWDGTGYPHGLKAESIPVGARLFTVADTFDAMTSDRPYRKALSVDAAVAEIKRCSGSQFDPEVVRAFERAEEELRWRREIDSDRRDQLEDLFDVKAAHG